MVQGFNFIVEFTDLPLQYATKEMRQKFDADQSGILELCNSKGENEIQHIEQELGLDLSKYKKEVKQVKTQRDYVGPVMHTQVELNDGTQLEYIQEHGCAFEHFDRIERNGNITNIKGFGENSYPDNIWCDGHRPHKYGSDDLMMPECTVEKNVEYNGEKGLTKTVFIQDASGMRVVTRYERGTEGSSNYYFEEIITPMSSEEANGYYHISDVEEESAMVEPQTTDTDNKSLLQRIIDFFK